MPHGIHLDGRGTFSHHSGMSRANSLAAVVLMVVFAPVIALIIITCGPQVTPAHLVLTHGKIITLEERQPEAQALAVRGNRIIAIGSDAEIQPYIGADTRVIDLEGTLAIPGFIESHAHFMSLGRTKMQLDLNDTKNWDDIIATVEAAARTAEPGEWIRGRGWHQDKWDAIPTPNVEGLPLHDRLSDVTPDNPVYLRHASGHAAIVNAKAMDAAGIDRKTPDPAGGEIVRGPDGNPIGLLREKADELVDAALQEWLARRTPEEVDTEIRRAITLATEECLARGITTFCDAGSSFDTIDVFKTLAGNGELDLRLWVMIAEDNDSLQLRLPEYKIIGLGDNHLTVRAIKRQIDGALGSHGAWLLEPYADLPTSVGLNTEPIEEMLQTARLALEHGFQLCTHAIGDRANRETLDIYEDAFLAHPDRHDLRWRIEHAQHLHSTDIPRFAELGVIAAMQGCHCTSDGPWVPKRLGDTRAKEGAYVWQKLQHSGAIICNGTDAPVERVDPLANFYASVTRQLPDGSQFYPKQCMTREEALRSYTINAAYAAFEEDIKGSLSVGKLADITILERDIMTIPAAEILDTEVRYTIIGGRIKYQR